VKDQLSRQKQGRVPEKWDGRAAGRIIQTIVQELHERESSSDSPAQISRGASVSEEG
jgi:hypothetical protein